MPNTSLRRSSPSLLLPLVALLLATAAPADELRLDDGRVLVGKVVEKKDVYEVTTYDGTVTVPRVKVVQHRTDAELRTALADTARDAGDTPFALLNLAADARDYGLEPEMWRCLDSLLAAPEDQLSEPLRRRRDEFLAGLEPQLLPRKWRTAATKYRVHHLLESLRHDAGAARTAAVVELLAREPNADQELRREARRNAAERRRIAALTALQRRALAGNEQFVLRTAILDSSKKVREAALALAPAERTAAAVQYLAPGLMHENATIRVRTAEAFAELHHVDAVRLLVLAGPNAGKALVAADSGVRGHAAFINQQAYIRDYDVEVAQAAFIADPKVDVLHSGSVLDVTVAGVIEERVIVRAYQQALKKLTNVDPGANPRTWPSWLAELQLPAARAATAPPTGRR